MPPASDVAPAQLAKAAPGDPDRITSPILRFRAGFLVLLVLLIICAVVGNFVAKHISLGFWWATLVGLLVGIGLGAVLARLRPFTYLGLAACITALLGYLTYDFCHSALDWSSTTSLVWSAIAVVLVAFTLYDFRRLKHEVRKWVEENL